LFALVKWAAFKNITAGITGKRFLWAFDEPETHLFPAAQRAFFEAIKKLSGTSVQCVISTHSTVFIDRTKMKHIKSFNLKDATPSSLIAQLSTTSSTRSRCETVISFSLTSFFWLKETRKD
jgi:predicted ATP-dependent endonuclease of OLD family